MTAPNDLVRASWARVSTDMTVLGNVFYEELFKLAPGLQNTLFGKVDMKVQGTKVMTMVGAAVSLLEKPDKLVPVLIEAGAKHAGYGAEEPHYPVVGTALLNTLRRQLGRDFTPDVEAAWTGVYGVVQSKMIEGHRTPEGVRRRAEFVAKQQAKSPNDLVRASWARVSTDMTVLGGVFYEELFKLAPGLQNTLFGKVDMKVQGTKVMTMVGAAVSLLEQPEKLVPVLIEAGAKHAGYGAEEPHYPVVGTALLNTLRRQLGRDFTPDVEAAWKGVYGVVQSKMIEGHRTPEGVRRRAEFVAKQQAKPAAAASCESGNCTVTKVLILAGVVVGAFLLFKKLRASA